MRTLSIEQYEFDLHTSYLYNIFLIDEFPSIYRDKTCMIYFHLVFFGLHPNTVFCISLIYKDITF